jgi:hypothetical protein
MTKILSYKDVVMQAVSLRLPDAMFFELVSRAKANAISQTEVIRAALENYFQTPASAKPQSAADMAAKWIGICDGGPSDLSSNPKYMEDFGK